MTTGKNKIDEIEDGIAANAFSNLLDSLNNQPRLMAAAALGAFSTILFWAVALFFPRLISLITTGNSNSNADELLLPNTGTFIVFALFFTAPFVVVYSLSKLLYPNLENDEETKSGMMSSFQYRENAAKQWKVLIVAGIAGAANCALLIFISGVFK